MIYLHSPLSSNEPSELVHDRDIAIGTMFDAKTDAAPKGYCFSSGWVNGL